MPVATRRSQAGGVTRKAPARKVRTTRSTTNRQNSSNWENDGDGDGDGDGDDDGDGDGDGDDDGDDNDADGQDNPIDSGARALSIFGGTKGHGHGQSSNVDDAVEPLLPREVVDQIDNEVEEFAENLDKFLDQLRESGRRPYHLALELVNKFKVIAHDSARKLDDDYRKERLRQSLRQKQPLVASTSLKLAGSQSRARPDKIALRRQRQQEADVWDLFRIMLEVHHNPDTPSPQQRREDIAAMGPVNHYTTEQELWKRFLLVNDSARERNLVKGWLEQTADHQAGTVGDIMEELEAEYGRSNGLWSHGWMDSREQIKNEKRMRAWPAPDADPLPHLRTKDKTELLVTSLDPDAATRQERVLERSDMEFERAIWTVCWEMLRRGKTWQEVSQWCQEHHEGWRAIVLGQGCDPSQVRSNIRLRRMAFLASQYELSSDHEAAVYGLLGGNTKAVQKVCRSMDDHLYAHYCATLLRQFEQFLAAEVPIRAPKSSLPDENLQDPERAIFDLLEKLRKEPDTKEESIMPMKIIESYVIANDVASMVHTLGHALSVTDQQSGREEKMIAHIEPFWDEKEKNQPEESIGLDPHALRIATHMSIILDIVAPQNLQGDEVIAKSNVTSAYVQALRAAGKRDLIPVYASRLTPGAYVMAMSQVFEDITAPKEQDQTLKLLRSYKLDVTWVLNEHVGHVLSKRLSDIPRSQKPVNILEASDNPKHPGQQIVNGFLDDGHPEQDTHILASLKWYDIVEGLWKDTFFSLSLSLRKALRMFEPSQNSVENGLTLYHSCRQAWSRLQDCHDLSLRPGRPPQVLPRGGQILQPHGCGPGGICR